MSGTELVVFSPDVLAAKVTTLGQFRGMLEALQVVDSSSVQLAADCLVDLQSELKSIESMKKSALGPLRESEQQIRGWFRPVENALEELVSLIKSKIAKYDLDARDLQRKAFAEASAAHAAGDNVAARDALQVSNEHAAKRKAKGASTREVWRAEIVDAGAVPREWCIPDEARIKAMARGCPAAAEPTPIPGVQFIRESVVIGRPRTKK